MTESTPKKKGNYLVKEVRFGREKLTLYSLDGLTWSTRRNELADIKARQEREKITFNEIKGVAEAEEPATAAASEEEGSGAAAAEEETPRRRFKGAKPAAPVPAAKKGKPNVSLVAPKTKAKHATETAKVVAPKKRGSTTPTKKSPKAKAKKRRAA